MNDRPDLDNGVKTAVEALRANDKEASRQLSQANIELLKLGYHKKPESKE